MKTMYRGYEIDVTREKCLGGWNQLYFSVYRVSDGLEVIADFSESEDTVREMTGYMKERVDEFIASKGKSELMEEEYGNGTTSH